MIPDLNTGGAERTTVDIAQALVKSGGTALVVSEGGRLVDELEAIGAAHITLPVKSKNPLTIWKNAARLQKIIRTHKVDLIHARSRAPAWSCLIAARREKIPFVTTYHGFYSQKSAIKALYNSVMARADTVIANSHYTASQIESRSPFAKGNITVIHRGSDISKLAPASVTEDRRTALATAWGLKNTDRVLLNIARVTSWKGHSVIIDALAELAQSGDTETIAILAGDAQGRAAYVEELKTRINANGLENRVRLVGHCDDVGAAMALADVSVVASIQPEAFGRAAVEAQAACVPVIVSDLGAVPETVLAPPEVSDEERTGWRVPPGDPKALANAIREVFAMDTGERDELIKRAQAHATAHFSIEKMCAETLAVYDKLCS
ncbi:MAG: glycosyltransferase family 4 protein [Rhodobacteraceae bacterium]|nr:glycosyltransferase family 4 protein [Paracoccaceae bacterium]